MWEKGRQAHENRGKETEITTEVEMKLILLSTLRLGSPNKLCTRAEK